MKSRLPMRFLFPLLITFFALMEISITYLVSRSGALEQVKIEIRNDLSSRITSMQGTLRLLLELNQLAGVERMIASFGTMADNEIMLLTNERQQIIASTRRQDTGMPLHQQLPIVEGLLVRQVLDQRKVVIRLSEDGRWRDGYGTVCRSGSGGLREQYCGLLFQRVDFRYHVAKRLDTLNKQTLYNLFAIFLLAAVLMMMLQFLLTHRAERLARTAGDFAAGNRQVRCEISGVDELARVAASVDQMMDQLVEDEKELLLAREVFMNAGESIIITNAHSQIIDVNPEFERTTGYTRDEVLGVNPSILSSGRHDENFYRAMWMALQSDGQWSGEIWDRRKSGEVYPKWLTVSVIRNAEGEPSYYVGIFKDITLQKETEERLQSLAYYDPLTRLPNRLLFRDRLQHELDVSDRHKVGTALFFIDLDRFKQVNDTLGHDIGDELLVSVASRVRECLRSVDTVARLGGDEFTVILSDLDERDVIARLAGDIIDALQRVFILRGHEVYIGASIGIGLYPADGADMESLLKSADEAMYRAKQAGRGNYKFASEHGDTSG